MTLNRRCLLLLLGGLLLSCGDEAAPALQATPAQATAASAVSAGGASSGCGRDHAAGLSLQEMTSSGVKRTYRLYVPKAYDPARKTPLVLNFHGFASNGFEQEAYTRMTAKADEAGFITVAPDGSGELRRWYIYGTAEAGYVDDFVFTAELIDHLATTLCIDPDRIYATGMSNGGGMSAQSGCRLNDRLAAIAPVAGSPYSAALCQGKTPMPAIIFHGTNDQSVPFEGGAGGRLGLALRGVRQNASDWARHNGCAEGLAVQRLAPDVLRESYVKCPPGAEVVLYVVEAGGHTWPGANDAPQLGRTTHSIDATSLIWDFFAAHPRSSR